VLGCKEAQKVEVGAQTANKPAEPSQQIYTQAVDATRWSETEPRVPVWKITWKNATLDVDQAGGLSGVFRQVNGEMFKKERAASKFSAASGEAHRESGDLALTGDVVVHSTSNSSTLRCDHVHYSSKGKQLITATGRVRLQGHWGAVSGLATVIATPDLKTFGTPDLFPNQ
jgi:hypothetical protein